MQRGARQARPRVGNTRGRTKTSLGSGRDAAVAAAHAPEAARAADAGPVRRRGTPCRGSAPDRRTSRAAAADGRNVPPSPPPPAARTAPARATPGSARARRAAPGSGCCSRACAGGRTGCGSPGRSSGRGRRTSAPPPKSPPAPPTRRAGPRRTTASRRSSAAHRGSGAPPSAAGSAPRRRPPRPLRADPRRPASVQKPGAFPLLFAADVQRAG